MPQWNYGLLLKCFQHLLWLPKSLVLNPTDPKGNLSAQAGHLTVTYYFIDVHYELLEGRSNSIRMFPIKKKSVLGTSFASFGNTCLRLLPAQILPCCFSCLNRQLVVEPHLPVTGSRICGVMLHYPCWSRDTSRAGLGMESFPGFPRKNMGRCGYMGVLKQVGT